MAGDDFVFDWTKKLGFKENPFSSEVPDNIEDFFTGYGEERKNLNYFVLEKQPFGTVRGEEGLGKTSMLKWVSKQLRNHRDKVRVAYINASNLEKERDLIEGLTEPLMNLYERKVAKKQEKIKLEETGKFIYSKLGEGQRLLVLLDDVGGLPQRYISLFRYFFDNKIGVQLIVAGEPREVDETNITQVSDKDWLEIRLDGLGYEEMVEMLRSRIRHYGQEKIFPFQEEMLEEIYEESDGNPKDFLDMCREKAVKLSLDRDYIEGEMEKVEEEKRRKREEGKGSGLISIKLGESEEKEEEEGKDELLEMLEAPDEDEQEEMLEEMEKGEGEKEEGGGEEREESPGRALGLEFDESDDDYEDEGEGKRKDDKEAKETEELLEQLTQEFDED